MSKSKRLLSLFISVLMILMSIPASQLISANADDTYNPAVDGVVAFDKVFNYTEAEDAAADGWSVSTSGLVKLKIVNGKPVFEQVDQKILTNAGAANPNHSKGNIYKFPAGPVSADLANRTQIINEDGKYQGEVTVDFTADIDLLQADKYTHSSGVSIAQSYADIYTGNTETSGNLGMLWRVRNNSYQMQNSSTTDDAKNPTNTVTPEKGLGGSVIGTPVMVSTTINTVTQDVSGYLDGFNDVMTGPTYSLNNNGKEVEYINDIDFQMMQRLGIGSTITVSDVKVTVKNPYFGDATKAVLAQLPDKLDVADVNNVKERTVTLPEIDGVKWTTSSANASINGSTLSLTRVKGENVEVAVKATFTADGIKYSKEYAMTLAEDAYTIRYYDIDGEFVDSMEAKEGECASDIPAPAEENYKFIGWYEEGADTAFDFTKTISKDTNLYAKYEGADATVVFMADGKQIGDPLTGKFGSTVEGTIPSIPAKEGCTAIGWYVGDTIFTSATEITSTNMVVTAKYAEGILNTYTVTFKVDGEVYGNPVTVVGGYPMASVPADPAKANYTFAGWTLNGSAFDVTSAITSNITLDAKFDANPVKVSFYMDEAMNEFYTSGTGYYNTAYGTLPVPTKAEHLFLGWKTVDGNDFTAETVVTEPISVYATWESTVKVIFDEDTTGYTSLTGNNVEFFSSSPYTELSLDNGPKTTYVKNLLTDRNITSQIMIAKFKVPVGDADTTNRTQVYNNKLVGDYEVSYTMDGKLAGKWGDMANAPYGQTSTGLVTGSSINPILMNRITSSSIQSFNTGSVATNTFNAEGKTGVTTSYTYSGAGSNVNDEGAYTDVTVNTRYNSETGYAELSMEGNSTGKAYGTPSASTAGINGFYFKLMGCQQIGDFIRIKHVKVTQYSPVRDADYLKLKTLA